MKTTIIKYGFIALSICALASCNKIDTPPIDRETSSTFWDKKQSAEYALNSCYPNLNNIFEVMYTDALTDNCYSKVDDFSRDVGNGSFGTNDPYVLSTWKNRYDGIKKCNILLNNIDKVENLAPDLKSRYIAEATVIRAYHYFELVSKFGDVPYFENEISISESYLVARTPKTTIITNINNAIDLAVVSLPDSYSDGDIGRITKGAALALKARIMLFENNWAAVETITNSIMGMDYQLFTSYEGLFQIENENNSEVILDIQYQPLTREHNIQYQFVAPSISGYSQLSPLQELVDDYIMENGSAIYDAGSGYDENDPYINRDPRLTASIIYDGNSYENKDGSFTTIYTAPGSGADAIDASSNVSVTGYYIKKYYDKSARDISHSGLNVILIRYADILLMNAEAKIELGTFDQAAWNNTIKLIRERAGFTDPNAIDYPAGLSQDQLRTLLRRERRCELAFEGTHRNDIIRWKTAETALNGWCHGMKTDQNPTVDGGYVRIEARNFNAAKHYLWPIPQSERDMNSNLTQNVNW